MTRAGKLTLSTAPLSIIIPTYHWHQSSETAAAAEAREICPPRSEWPGAQKPSAEVSQSNAQTGQNLRRYARAVSPRVLSTGVITFSAFGYTSNRLLSGLLKSSTQVADSDSYQTRPVGRAARSVASVTVLAPSATGARPRVSSVRAIRPGSSSASSRLPVLGMSSLHPRLRPPFRS